MKPPDTIVAIATPPGRGAVGVIRLSGPDVPRIAAALLGTVPAPRHASLKAFLDHDGGVLDQGLVLYFPEPASFTGECVLELHGHGGAVVLDRVLERALALGARLARPGEFSERAFLNGKMDLAQAEAVADLIDAASTAAARAAVRSMQGEFSERIRALQSQLTDLRTYVEAAIDFPDEEVDFLSDSGLRQRLERLSSEFVSVTAAARQGALLREGLTVVIAGQPNAGKSSILNQLAGDAVAIVTSIPGTTRDVLRQQVQLDGLPVNLIDTAGLRAAGDIVEEEGIRRARAEIARADRILYVIDATSSDREPDARELEKLPADVPVSLIMNKIDLLADFDMQVLEPPAGYQRIPVSARTGAGIGLLRAHLKNSAQYRDQDSGALAARRRHVDALGRAHDLVKHAASTLCAERAFELFAEDLRLAQRSLGEITGEVTSEDLLGKIFGSFCIGK